MTETSKDFFGRFFCLIMTSSRGISLIYHMYGFYQALCLPEKHKLRAGSLSLARFRKLRTDIFITHHGFLFPLLLKTSKRAVKESLNDENNERKKKMQEGTIQI